MPPWLPDCSVSIWMLRSSRAFSWRWTERGQAPQRHKPVQALPRRLKPQLQVVSRVTPLSSCLEGKDTHTSGVCSLATPTRIRPVFWKWVTVNFLIDFLTHASNHMPDHDHPDKQQGCCWIYLQQEITLSDGISSYMPLVALHYAKH